MTPTDLIQARRRERLLVRSLEQRVAQLERIIEAAAYSQDWQEARRRMQSAAVPRRREAPSPRHR